MIDYLFFFFFFSNFKVLHLQIWLAILMCVFQWANKPSKNPLLIVFFIHSDSRIILWWADATMHRNLKFTLHFCRAGCNQYVHLPITAIFVHLLTLYHFFNLEFKKCHLHSHYCLSSHGYHPHCSCKQSFSPGQLKQTEQQPVVEQAVVKEDPSTLDELQPRSLVFTLEDDSDKPNTCEPAAVTSSKPSPVDPKPHPPNSEGPSLSKSKEILHNHQSKKIETQEVSLSVVGKKMITLFCSHAIRPSFSIN